MKAAMSEASSVDLRAAAGRSSGGKAALRALAGMKAGRGRTGALHLATKAAAIERAAENGEGLTVARHPNVASLGKRRSPFPKSI